MSKVSKVNTFLNFPTPSKNVKIVKSEHFSEFSSPTKKCQKWTFFWIFNEKICQKWAFFLKKINKNSRKKLSKVDTFSSKLKINFCKIKKNNTTLLFQISSSFQPPSTSLHLLKLPNLNIHFKFLSNFFITLPFLNLPHQYLFSTFQK